MMTDTVVIPRRLPLLHSTHSIHSTHKHPATLHSGSQIAVSFWECIINTLGACAQRRAARTTALTGYEIWIQLDTVAWRCVSVWVCVSRCHVLPY